MPLPSKKDVIEVIVALLVVLSMAFGAFTYFAKASDLKLVDASQKLHFTSHAINEVQARIWKLEERNGSDNCYNWQNVDDRNEYQKLKMKLDSLRKKEDQLIKKTVDNGG